MREDRIPTVREILEQQITDHLEFIARSEQHKSNLTNQLEITNNKIFSSRTIIQRCRDALKQLGE